MAWVDEVRVGSDHVAVGGVEGLPVGVVLEGELPQRVAGMDLHTVRRRRPMPIDLVDVLDVDHTVGER